MTNEENKTPQSPSSANNLADANTPAIEAIKDTAKDVIDKAKDSAGQAYGIAADAANSKITEQKAVLSGGLSGVADSIRRIGEDLRASDENNPFADLTAKYGNVAADKVEDLSEYFERRDLKDIYRDVEGFARRQPTAFIAVSFGVGLLVARFLKSGAKGSKNFGESSDRRRFQDPNNSDNSTDRVINAS